MNIGDLVKWNGRADRTVSTDPTQELWWTDPASLTRQVTLTGVPLMPYAWLDAKETFWHTDDNLELVSENR